MCRPFPFTKFGSALFAACLSVSSHASESQEAYPQKPITIVVSFAAGSPSDQIARLLAKELEGQFSRPVIVENKPGGSQLIAATSVFRSPPDGYNLFLPSLPNVVAASVQEKQPFTGFTDFEPIASIVEMGLLLATSAGLQAKSFPEFATLLQANRGKYTYGSSGIGSVNHLVGEALNDALKTTSRHIPYKGANQVLMDLVAGHIDYALVAPGAMAYATKGQINAMALGTEVRDAQTPALITFKELGMAGIRPQVSWVLLGPPGMNPATVSKLNQAVDKALRSPTFAQSLQSMGGGISVTPRTPRQTRESIHAAEQYWRDLVKRLAIALE